MYFELNKRRNYNREDTLLGCTRIYMPHLSNIKMKSLIIFATLVGLSYQHTTTHTTHAPRSTHEPNEHDSYIFHYDYLTQKMLIIKGRNCYIFTLSDQEKVDVHTDSGLVSLEIKFLQMIGSGTATSINKGLLEHQIVTACGTNILHYYTVS